MRSAITSLSLAATVAASLALVAFAVGFASFPSTPAPAVLAHRASIGSSSPCVPQPVAFGNRVGGFGEIALPRFPGARRLSYDDQGLSRYQVAAAPVVVLRYYAQELADRCWQVAELTDRAGVWSRSAASVRIAVTPQPAGRSVVDYQLSRGQVLSATFTVATHEDACAAGTTMCVGYGCLATGSPCPPGGTTAVSCTAGQISCTAGNGTTYCYTSTGYCPTSPVPCTTPLPSCPADVIGTSGTPYVFDGNGCPVSCAAPTCTGSYTGTGAPGTCNATTCPSGCTYDPTTSCASGCATTTSPSSCPSPKLWCSTSSGVFCMDAPCPLACAAGQILCTAGNGTSYCYTSTGYCPTSPVPCTTPLPSCPADVIGTSGTPYVFDGNGCPVSCAAPTCTGEYQQVGYTVPTCNYTKCPSGCNWSNGCPTSCYSPPSCSGEYQQLGTTSPNCNWSKCPNGCTWNAQGCPSGCSTSSGGGGMTKATCESGGGLWCQPTFAPHCHFGPNPPACEADTPSGGGGGGSCPGGYWCSSSNSCVPNGSPCGATTCAFGYYLCNGTCVLNGASCTGTPGPGGGCPFNQFWCSSSNSCVNIGTSCNAPSLCPSPKYLCNNVCVEPGSPCGGVTPPPPGPPPRCLNGYYWCTITSTCLDLNLPCGGPPTPVPSPSLCPANSYWCPQEGSCKPLESPCGNPPPPPPPTPPPDFYTPFIRGDANSDGQVDIADVSTITNFINLGGSVSCGDAADVNDDGNITQADADALAGFLFKGTHPAPRPPYPAAGNDPTADRMWCGGYVGPGPGPGPAEPSEAELKRMLEEMQRNSKSMRSDFRRVIKREADAAARTFKRCGITPLPEYFAAVGGFEGLLSRLAAATTFEAGRQIMEDLIEAGQAIEDGMRELPRYKELCQYQREVPRAAKNLERVFARLKAPATRSGNEQITALLKQLEEQVVALRTSAGQFTLLLRDNPEEALEAVQDFWPRLDDAHDLAWLLERVVNARRSLGLLRSDERALAAEVRRLRRAGEDVAEAEALLERFGEAIAEVQQAIRDRVDLDELIDLLGAAHEVRQDLDVAIDERRGRSEYEEVIRRERPIRYELPDAFKSLPARGVLPSPG